MFNLKIIWFALLMLLVIYLFLGLYAGANFGPPMKKDAFGILRILLYVVSFITLIATRYIRKRILSSKGLPQWLTQTYRYPDFQTYSAAMILSWALSEGIGIYGLILFLMGKNTMDLYLLVLISAVAIFLYRPKRDEVVTLPRDVQDDSTNGGAIS